MNKYNTLYFILESKLCAKSSYPQVTTALTTVFIYPERLTNYKPCTVVLQVFGT